MKFKIEKVSNRYAIVIPADAMHTLGLKLGSTVEVKPVEPVKMKFKLPKTKESKRVYDIEYKVGDIVKSVSLNIKDDVENPLTEIMKILTRANNGKVTILKHNVDA